MWLCLVPEGMARLQNRKATYPAARVKPMAPVMAAVMTNSTNMLTEETMIKIPPAMAPITEMYVITIVEMAQTQAKPDRRETPRTTVAARPIQPWMLAGLS